MKAVRGSEEDVCCGMLRAAACVDESDHHTLMYVSLVFGGCAFPPVSRVAWANCDSEPERGQSR